MVRERHSSFGSTVLVSTMIMAGSDLSVFVYVTQHLLTSISYVQGIQEVLVRSHECGSVFFYIQTSILRSRSNLAAIFFIMFWCINISVEKRQNTLPT